ncbi:MAG: DUF4276 family protein [Phycisphaerae bacterium]|nr:DUF4276 family protein [Phycisphaerae bacterium]
MVRVRLYIEGGGDSRSLHIKCREGFRKLLERAGFKGRMPSTRACGGRNAAYDDFKTALRTAAAGDYPVLLVDSEAPVNQPRSPWQHLQSRDGWEQPAGADDDQAQLMVQCMETWCLADRNALGEFFGSRLRENALPSLDNLEAKAKETVQEALANATRDCGRQRGYEKGRRSFELLGQLDPAELKTHLPHFVRLCQMLESRL